MKTVSLISLIGLLPFAAVAECEGVALEQADKQVLEAIAQIEKNTKSVQTILMFAPVAQIMNSQSTIEALFNASNSDLKLQADSIRAMGKIGACKSQQTIALHILDIDLATDTGSCRSSFFEKLEAMYGDVCTG